MSVYNSIRAALEVKLSGITNIPPIVYENTSFSPTTGTPYISCNFLPTSRRPSEVGNNPFNKYSGLFAINVYTPEEVGSKENQDLCNLILAAFPSTHDLSHNGQVVRVEYAEQGGASKSPPWFITPLNIAWYAYDKE